MARPIRETPILRGKDAKRFMKLIASPVKESAEEIKKAHEVYERFKKIANFNL